ncbi:hypothetical protein niasHS_015517 [Heterodera schachtii]|uniref:BTB domain-containing protein n=1 Tax=Heterodera schachtii TaxID=97005 RepID=A0ABD2HSG8_HETSC
MNLQNGNVENGQKMNTANPDILTDRMKMLLCTAKGADAHFLVGKSDKKELVHAHKGILMTSSSVFEAMFQKEAENSNRSTTDGKAEKDCPVLVPDVDAEVFKVMLRFIYSDDLSELNGKNAVEVLYTALKFNVAGLVKACVRFPISKLSSNVFAALSIARFNDLHKDYCNDCLAYIDGNADTLIKSDEFLQIDQKLLCEILERDELQTRGEFSIWEAAFRWADAKCRQNGIECSAENRRSVLGPALFKIRFPLISKEKFSDKIVPSGVLTLDEVIGVYQFFCHPNFCTDSGLYPLQFPSHWRLWTFGTIVMDIEKVSEFLEENDRSSRHSKVVYIKGFPWKIMAQINLKKERAEKYMKGYKIIAEHLRRLGSEESAEKLWKEGNEKLKESEENCLSFYLYCDTSKDDSKRGCVCSATFRIIAKKKCVRDLTYKFYDKIFNNKLKWRGFDCSFDQFMDPNKGFYNKEDDKLTLTIDLKVFKMPIGH